MKSNKWIWGHRQFEFYKAPVDRKKQAGIILGVILGEVILPMGITAYGLKKFLKWRPLFLVR